MSTRPIEPVWLGALILAGGCASSGGISNVDAAKVRVVSETEMVRGCQVLGTVADNELEISRRRRRSWADTSPS